MLDLPLAYLHRPAALSTVNPSLLVLMHGVGSNEADLFGLADTVALDWHVLSLRGPLTLGPRAHAWFEVQFGPTGPRIHEEQERQSRALLTRTIPQAAQQLGIPASRVVVGGFSQGGIMGLSLLLTQPALAQGAVVMHSRLLEQVEPLIAPAAQLSGKQLWVSHGVEDAVIPLSRAQAIRDTVQKLPLNLTYQTFPGGHEIRPAEWEAVRRWLSQVSLN